MRRKGKQKLKLTFLGMLAAALVAAAAPCALSVQARGTETGSRSGLEDEERLTRDEEKIYNEMKAAAGQIAAGKQASTQIVVSGFTALGDSQEEVDAAMNRVASKLLAEAGKELYWYDRDGGCQYSWNGTAGGRLSSITVSMTLLREYRGFDRYTADTDTLKAAKPAMDKAWSIVSGFRSRSDYQKLKGYLTEICRLATLESPEAQDRAAAMEDPWPLIWVFDGDPATGVGSEGYAKAFQYLCDLSEFEDARCYTTAGEISGEDGAHAHMWNIVSLEGGNYLVDAMNCDAGAFGAPDGLFLAGGQGSVRDGYTITLEDGEEATYWYYTNQSALLGSVLNLSGYSYLNPAERRLTISAPKAADVVFGDAVDDQVLEGGSAIDAKGREVLGAFTWAEDVDFYGEAGANTLKAVFVPDNPQYEAVEDVPVSVRVGRKPVSVTAEDLRKAYGEPDPELSYTSEGVVEGYPLKGSLARDAGEETGSYVVRQGDLTDANNPNYTITFTEGSLEIGLAEYTEQVERSQTIWPGGEGFTPPVFLGAKGEQIKGLLTYTFNGQSDLTNMGLKAELAKLSTGAKGRITYTFVPEKNYGSKSGDIDISVRTLEFTVGNAQATAANAVTVKRDAAYGDVWSEIVKIGSITAKGAKGSDSDSRHFRLRESGTASVGNGQSFQVLYSGTIDGKTYTDEVVLSGTVDVKKRAVTVSAGSYKVSKTYDGTRTGGTASGRLAMGNVLSADSGSLSLTAAPAGYTSPNVNGQKEMTVNVSLSGAAAGNYELGNETVEVPCEIKPKTITPTVKASGTYTYTGRAITPSLSVSDGSNVLAASDYEMVLSNNTNVGMAKVSVKPKSGSNYTWSPAAETTFPIGKGDYRGTKTAYASMEYGGTAVFSLVNMLPEGSKLGEIRVSDPDKILDGSPWVAGQSLSCKLSGDSSKGGKTAVVTVPVEESPNYHAYELTLTVAMADGNRAPAASAPAGSGSAGGTDVPAPNNPKDPISNLPDSMTPGGNAGAPDKEGTVDQEGLDVDQEAKRSGINPWMIAVWGVLGASLAVGAAGTIYLVRHKESGLEDMDEIQ